MTTGYISAFSTSSNLSSRHLVVQFSNLFSNIKFKRKREMSTQGKDEVIVYNCMLLYVESVISPNRWKVLRKTLAICSSCFSTDVIT